MAAAFLLCGRTAAADDLTLQAVGAETGSWSSNPLLSTTGSKPLFGSTTSPELIVNDVTPTLNLNADTTVSENIFNQSEFNSTDLHENAGLFDHNQLWKIGSGLRIDYDTTRTSELTDYGLNNIVSRHLGIIGSPQITYTPTPVDALSLTGGVQQSTYDSSQFVGYDLFTAAPAYSHRFDPMNTGILQMQAQRYQTITGPSQRLDSVGPSVGWQTVFSPRLSANAAVGAEASRQYDFGAAVGPWIYNYTFAAGLDFKGMQDKLNASAARQQFPYGNGTDSLQTTFSFTETHDLNARFSLNAGASYLITDYQASSPGNIDTLTSATAGLTYHATRQLDLSATYQYGYETLTGTSATANNNTALLTLAYRPEAWAL